MGDVRFRRYCGPRYWGKYVCNLIEHLHCLMSMYLGVQVTLGSSCCASQVVDGWEKASLVQIMTSTYVIVLYYVTGS